MQEEIAEITEICTDDRQTKNNGERGQDDIEIGLEIVALEMGRILEELKDNLERLPWEQTKEDREGNEDTAKKKVYDAKTKDTNKSNRSAISVSASNPVKYQQLPNSKTKRSASFNKNYYQKTKPQDTIRPVIEEKKDDQSKPKQARQKPANKPNYQVQKTNYPLNYEKLMRLHNSVFPKNASSNCYFVNSKTSMSHRTMGARPGEVLNRFSSMNATNSTTSSNSKAPISPKQGIKRQSTVSIRNLVTNDPLKHLRDRVETAIREKKTFTVCGNYYTIRRALLARGWIEKIRILYNTYDRDNLRKLQSTNILELLHNINDPQNGYVYKRMIMSKLLGQHQVDFYWDQNFDCFRVCHDNVKLTMVNRFRRGIFSYTSKQGLCESMKRAYWYQKPGVSCVRHPRSYNLSNSEDPKDFINDFKISAAMALLKWIVNNQENFNTDKISSPSGKIPFKIYHFAVAELSKIIRKCRHEDIDFEIEDAMDYEWNEFLEFYYKLVHVGNRFKSESKEKFQNILSGARSTLKKIEKYWPHLAMDGMMNIWILKPTNGSRGEGIYLCRTLQYILKIIKSNTTRRYIVQKYIVVIDYPKNPKASTGGFELLYKQEIHKLPDVESESLKLVGTRLSESYFYTPETKKDFGFKELCSSEDDISRQAHNISQISSDMKKTLENLLALIQAERERRNRLKHRYTSTNEQKRNKLSDNQDKDDDSNNSNDQDLKIEVIKAIKNDTEISKSEDAIEMRSSIKLNEEKLKRTLAKPKNTTKTLFNDIIESIKNLTFNYRSTNQT
ncbi:hypothetical protein ILUMI_26942 [Ignelater luminosus]|uniref:Tubulin glycylase 3A-like n=1 Tax=Ignelater luminosus TaxID=2038154 RepID=A0A8K0C755_IGNLU|nr:hypothetical protein ILUMI_26942 [Ignelater luminosus]